MSLYVSDPKMWEQAFKDLSSGKINPYAYNKGPQTRRGLAGRYFSTFHVPVKVPAKIVVPVKQITPMETVAEKPKSELKREKRESLPHVDPKRINKRDKPNITSRLPGVKKRRALLENDIFDEVKSKKRVKRIKILPFLNNCLSLPHLRTSSQTKRYTMTKPDHLPTLRKHRRSNLQCPVKARSTSI